MRLRLICVGGQKMPDWVTAGGYNDYARRMPPELPPLN